MFRRTHAAYPAVSCRIPLARPWSCDGSQPALPGTVTAVCSADRPHARAVSFAALCLGFSVGAASTAQPAHADETEALRRNVATHSQGKVNVQTITPTPVPGLFQVISEGEIFYVDSTGRYSFVGGSMIDMQQQRDLTAAELDRLHAIPFDRLPLQHAVKEVRGKGTRHVAVFEDPNCPICRVFTKFLDQIDDVTIYRFMYPVIAPQSEALAQAAWCSRDRASAWKTVMAGGQPPQAGAACDISGLASIMKFGETNRINNTPTVVLASGKRLVGATPPELFMQELEQGGRRTKQAVPGGPSP
jgi:thiol:disulfide interchange protein DsbC